MHAGGPSPLRRQECFVAMWENRRLVHWHISGGCGVVVAWIVGIAVAGPGRSQPPAHGDGLIQLVKFT